MLQHTTSKAHARHGHRPERSHNLGDKSFVEFLRTPHLPDDGASFQNHIPNDVRDIDEKHGSRHPIWLANPWEMEQGNSRQRTHSNPAACKHAIYFRVYGTMIRKMPPDLSTRQQSARKLGNSS